MKLTTHHAAFALALAALCGCTTAPTPIEQRIALRPLAFKALDAEQQERTRLAHIQIGDTTNMLWMAFGEPANITVDNAETNPGIETWTYVREQLSGPPLPNAGFAPGAMFAPSPPPPPERVKKIYILSDGVITDMDTQREPASGN